VQLLGLQFLVTPFPQEEFNLIQQLRLTQQEKGT